MKLFLDDKEIFEIDKNSQALLEDEMVFIEEWIVGMLKGKIAQREKQFKAEWDKNLLEDPSIESIPTKQYDYIQTVLNHPSYKNRKDRDEEEKRNYEAQLEETARSTVVNEAVK